MLEDRWREIENLYHSACERTPEERRAYLHRVCGDDGALRHEVESLLVHDGLVVSFLESSTGMPSSCGLEVRRGHADRVKKP
jgi:hypothetical protein